MLYGLNGYQSVEVLREVRARGFQMLRFGGPDERGALAEVRACGGFQPLVIVRDGDHVLELGEALRGCDVEFWNEPDGTIDGYIEPLTYAGRVPHFLEAVASVGGQPWIGAIGNLSTPSLGWLRQMIQALPHGLTYSVTVHRYPHGRSWSTPHPGFRSRLDEVTALHTIIGSRPWAVSEFGYHTAKQRRARWLPNCWPFQWSWTDQDVARFVRLEFEFWSCRGAQFAVLYQIVDGPENTKEHRFGIRRVHHDGSLAGWKPVADVLRQPDAGG